MRCDRERYEQRRTAAAEREETRAHSSHTRTRHHSHSAGLAFELLQPSARHRDSSTSSSEIDLDLIDPDGAHCIYSYASTILVPSFFISEVFFAASRSVLCCIDSFEVECKKGLSLNSLSSPLRSLVLCALEASGLFSSLGSSHENEHERRRHSETASPRVGSDSRRFALFPA